MSKRKNRTQDQWQALINEQLNSNLSAAEFCRQKDINPKYFSKRKTDYLRLSDSSKPATAFIRARAPTQTTQRDLVLQYKEVCLRLPSNSDAVWVAHFLKVLAS